MSFINRHTSLFNSLKTYCNTKSYGCFKSEGEIRNADKFPAVGLFLGFPIISNESSAFIPLSYHYMLVVMDLYTIDESTSEYSALSNTYDKLVDIVETMKYDLEDAIEPFTLINENEGSFMTGWITTISVYDNL